MVEQLGNYSVEQEVARGGMATIYAARHRTLGHPVGLKVLHPHLHEQASHRARFAAEARVMANLRHPNLLAVYDVLASPEHSVIVMELLSGCSLASYYQHMGVRLPPPLVIGLARAVASALKYAHERGVVHRDLKPGNVFLHCPGKRVVPKLVDFGVAKLETAEPEPRLTATGDVLGTPPFMAPEQFRDPAAVTGQADLFSLGVMLYEAVVGRLPFPGHSASEVMHQVLKRSPPTPRELVPSVPRDLEAVILGCLEKRVSRRYESAEQVLEALDPVKRRVGEAPFLARNVPKNSVLDPSLPSPPAAARSSLSSAAPSPSFPVSGQETVDSPASPVREAKGSTPVLEERETIPHTVRAVAGYRLLERLHTGARSTVYRGVQARSGALVILKLPSTAYPGPREVARLSHEYSLLRQLDLVGVPRALALEPAHTGLALVLADGGGQSLRSVLEASLPPLPPLPEVLDWAVQIAEILGGLHQAGVVHRDLSLDNLVVQRDRGRVELVDFALATTRLHHQPVEELAQALPTTLSYVSPEQTGRMNRPLDYRSDYYSLGAVLYHLLTGRPPVSDGDRLQQLHAILVQVPPEPAVVRSDVPMVVSDLVMRLLAKTAERRYQSARGLLGDLRRCRDEARAEGHVAPFSLGTTDRTDRFQVPQALYGRGESLAALHAAFKRAQQGFSELFLVTGASGVGKTSLIHEIYKPVTEARGFFIAGKFDPVLRDLPYGALAAAFQQLIQQIQSMDEAVVTRWREALTEALEPNGRVLTDLIPELSALLGEQPPVPKLSSHEARNRLHLALQRFLSCLAGAEHPLVILLDDLQWADVASLHLIRRLFIESSCPYLLLIGAYRDDEVEPTHSLALLVDELESAGAPLSRIGLGPLEETSVSELLAETLGCSTDACRPVAELVFHRTGGNALFVNELLRAAQALQLFTFDAQLGHWAWDLERLEAMASADSVLDLLIAKLRRLEDTTRRVLQIGACVGSVFSSRIVSLVAELPEAEVLRALERSVAAGFVADRVGGVPLILAQDAGPQAAAASRQVRFSHDRIQQAAFASIPEQTRLAWQQQVGQLLLRHLDATQREHHIFSIVTPLNASASALDDGSQRAQLAELNQQAARRSKRATAYATALEHLRFGISLLGEPGWWERYELALGLHVEAAEAAFLTARFDEMEQLIETVLERAERLLDKVRAYEIRINGYIAQRRKEDVIRTALPVLEMLGLRLPSSPTSAHVAFTLARTKVALVGRTPEALAALPITADPQILAAQRIATSISSTVYTTSPNLFAVLVLELVRLAARHGNTPFTPFAYALYGTLLCGVLGQVELGYRFGACAASLLDRLDAPEQRPQVEFTFAATAQRFLEPIGETGRRLRRNYRYALEIGNFEFAAASAGAHAYALLHGGSNLERVEDEIGAYVLAVEQLEQPSYLNYLRLYYQAVLNLRGASEKPAELRGPDFDITSLMSEFEAVGDQHGLLVAHVVQLLLDVLLGRIPQALTHAAEAERFAVAGAGMLPTHELPFLSALAIGAWLPHAGTAERLRLQHRLSRYQRRLGKLARSAPMNDRHRWQLVEAERQQLSGSLDRALSLYDQAIAGAEKHGFTLDAALASERAARCFLARDRPRVAWAYLRDAHFAYRTWGAPAKVEHLEQEFPRLRETRAPGSLAGQSVAPSSGEALSTAPGVLDQRSAFAALHVAAGPQTRQRHLAAVMKTLLGTAGAQRGLLVLERDERLVVEVVAGIEQDDLELPTGQCVQDRSDLAQTVVNQVVRSGETVVLPDAVASRRFGADAYITVQRVRSLACLPLRQEGRLYGLVYLENNLAPDVFGLACVATLEAVAAELSFSVANARRFQHLEQQNQALSERLAALERSLSQRAQEPDAKPA